MEGTKSEMTYVSLRQQRAAFAEQRIDITHARDLLIYEFTRHLSFLQIL